jgi:hypothetical protein
MSHPAHRRLAAGDREAPDGKPTLHLPDLGLLGQGDVGDQGSDLLARGLITHDLGHLDGLGVVHHHVPSEPRFRRVIGGHPVGEEERKRQAS